MSSDWDRVGVLTSIYITWYQNESSMCDLSGHCCHLISGLQNCLAEKKMWRKSSLVGICLSLFGDLSAGACSEQTYHVTVASCVNKMFLAADVTSCLYGDCD